mmetsp:Transcript_8309/g.15314  ORF Transcript_8309/g.15314 Transcript_8309/m.15314 type:complete len:267 (-) Transcript_8309:1051-1851(-)
MPLWMLSFLAISVVLLPPSTATLCSALIGMETVEKPQQRWMIFSNLMMMGSPDPIPTEMPLQSRRDLQGHTLSPWPVKWLGKTRDSCQLLADRVRKMSFLPCSSVKDWSEEPALSPSCSFLVQTSGLTLARKHHGLTFVLQKLATPNQLPHHSQLQLPVICQMPAVRSALTLSVHWELALPMMICQTPASRSVQTLSTLPHHRLFALMICGMPVVSYVQTLWVLCRRWQTVESETCGVPAVIFSETPLVQPRFEQVVLPVVCGWPA